VYVSAPQLTDKH